MGNIYLLPLEIIPLIVSHLNQPKDLYSCALINKLFYETTNPLLWQKLEIKNQTDFDEISTCLLASHQSLSQYVRHIVLGGSSEDLMLLLLLKHIPLLETVKVDNAHSISNISLQHLPHHCPHLKVLHLVTRTYTEIPFIISVGQHCRHLCKLIIEGNNDLSDEIFPVLAQCPLVELDLSTRPEVGGRGPDWLTGIDTSRGLHLLTSLTRLRLHSASVVSDIGANVLRTPTAWPHLTHLSLTGCRDITTAQLDVFLQSHPGLMELDLLGLPRSTDVFTPVISRLPGLHSLVLGSHGIIQPRPLYYLIHQCRSLTYLCLRDRDYLAYSTLDFPGVFDEYASCESGEFLENALNMIRYQHESGETCDDVDMIQDTDNSSAVSLALTD